MYSNVRNLRADLVGLAIAGSGFEVPTRSAILVSDRRHTAEHRIPGFDESAEDGCFHSWCKAMALDIGEGYRACKQRQLVCKCHEFVVLRIRGCLSDFYV